MTGPVRRIVVGGVGVGAGGVGQGREAMGAVTVAVRGAAMDRLRAAVMAGVHPVVMGPLRRGDRGRRSRVGGVPEKANVGESVGANGVGSGGIVGGSVRNGVGCGESVGEAKGLLRVADGVPARVDVTRVTLVEKEGRVVEGVATNLDRKEGAEAVEGGLGG